MLSEKTAILIKRINLHYHDVEHAEYDTRHTEILSGERKWWQYLGEKYVKDYGTKEDDVSILDVGSGTGFVFRTIVASCSVRHKMVSFDFSKPMLNTSRKFLSRQDNTGVRYVCGDAEYLPFTDESFDIVTVNGVLHHLPNYGACLNEINRILRYSGVLMICHEPNNQFFQSFIIRFMTSVYKILGGRVVSVSRAMQVLINEKLKDESLIERDLTRDEIIGLVEYNSIAEHRKLDLTRGFNVESLVSDNFKGYQLLEKRYTSTFHCGSNTWFMKSILPIINYLSKGQGTSFSLILKKKAVLC